MAQEDVDQLLGVLRTRRTTRVAAEGDERRHAAGGHPGAARRHRAGRPRRSPPRSGASRVTARRYLEHLAGEQVVERTVRYGGSGRPEVEYRLSRR